MTKIALDDDIVIAKIKNGTCRFDLGDADLVALKRLVSRQRSLQRCLTPVHWAILVSQYIFVTA